MINTVYALREALAMLAEEGVEAAWARHAAAAAQLHVRLKKRGTWLDALRSLRHDSSLKLAAARTGWAGPPGPEAVRQRPERSPAHRHHSCGP